MSLAKNDDLKSRPANNNINKLYRWLWKLFPKNEIVFYAKKPNSYVMFQEIHKYLPEVKIVASGRRTFSFLRSRKIPFRVWPGFPKMIIATQFIQQTYDIEEIKKVMIFHGMAKGYILDPRNTKFDLLLVMGDYIAERCKELGYSRYQVVGYPKIDRLFNGSIELNSYRDRFGLDSTKPTILYAPTYGNNSSLPVMTDWLEAIGENYNVLVKLHDISYPKFSKIISKIPGVQLIDDPDIVPYYSLADMMISDYSSVIFEFATLDRPIILIDRVESAFRQDTIGYQARDIGLCVKDYDGLKQAIERSIRYPAELSPNRCKYAKYIFEYLDGHDAERAARAIRDYAKELGIAI